MNEHTDRAERHLSEGRPHEWEVELAKAEALVSIAQSLDTLTTLAEEIAKVWRHPVTLVNSGPEPCPNYPERGG